MGTAYTNMVLRITALFLIFAAFSTAIPKPSISVPETHFEDAPLSKRMYPAAEKVISDLRHTGHDNTACSEVANITRQDVIDSVEHHQEILNSLENGCDCGGLPRQDEVSLASRLQTLRERGSEANQDNEANGDLWAQSHYMHCILTGLREAACHFPDVPTVTKPELCAGVAKASCEDYSASISATALTAAPAAQVDDIGETIDLEGLSCDSEWTDCRGCSSTGAYCGTPSGAQGEEGGQTAVVVCGEAQCTSR